MEHEPSFISDYWSNPQLAHDDVQFGVRITEEFNAYLKLLLGVYGRKAMIYGKSSKVEHGQLMSMNTTGNTLVAAIFAFASSLSSIGEQYQVYAGDIEDSLGQQTVLLREHRKRIDRVTADHVTLQQEFETLQGNATTAEEQAALEAKWNAVHTSLTQTLSTLHGMEAHRRTFVCDNLLHYANKEDVMLIQVAEIIQTLGLIHSSIDLSADFKREILAVLEYAQGVNNDVDDSTTEETLAALRRELATERSWKRAEAIMNVCFQVSENTATACQIAQQISSGIREGCENAVKACEKTLQSVAEDFENLAKEPDIISKVLPTESVAWKQAYAAMKEQKLTNMRLSRSVKVNHSQLAIILGAYGEAKAHLTAKVGGLKKEIAELESEKEVQLTEFNKLVDEIHRTEETLHKMKHSINIKAEEPAALNGIEESASDSPGKSFASRFPKSVFFKKDRTQETQIRINKLEKEQVRMEKDLYAFNQRFQETRVASFKTFADLVVKFMTTHYAMSEKVRTIMSEAINALESALESVAAVQRELMRCTHAITPLPDIATGIRFNCAQSALELVVQEVEDQVEKKDRGSVGSARTERSKLLPVDQMNTKARAKAERLKAKAEDICFKFKLPGSEFAIASYSCAYLPQKIPLQGRLYITPKFLCFAPLPIATSIGATKIVVPFSDVAEIKKARSAWGLMANSLVLTLVDGHRVFFTSFFNRDKCYNRIVDMSQDKENISRQDRTSSEPISTANSSQAHASVKTGDSKESEAASEEEPAWKRFDPRKQGGKSNELGDSGFLQVSGSSTKLAEVVDSFGEDGQAESELPEEPDFDVWTLDNRHDAVEALHEDAAKNVHYLPCDLQYIANFVASTQRDLWRELGEDEGDYDFEATSWNSVESSVDEMDQFPESIAWKGLKAPGNALQRRVKFKRPIENAGPFGKPIAHTSQRQRVYGCSHADVGENSVRVDGSDMLVFTVDTLFKGFIYADCFRASVLWTFTPLEPQAAMGQKGPSWVKAVVSTKVTFIKQISLSFVKRRIAKDNAEAVKAIGQTVASRLRESLAPQAKIPRLSPKKKSSKAQAVRETTQGNKIVVSAVMERAQTVGSKLWEGFNIWIGVLLLLHFYTLLVLYSRPVCTDTA